MRLIVWERTTHWVTALGRVLPADMVQVRQTRSLDACTAELVAAPQSLVVVELGEAVAADAVWRFLSDWGDRFPLARTVIVSDRRRGNDEWLAREAGAVDFITSPRRLAAIVGILRRHLRRLPPPVFDPVEQIWTNLPWPAYADPAASRRELP